MIPNRQVSVGCALALLAAVLVSGCGDDEDAPGPGGSTISGNVAVAQTAAAGSARGWLAWLGETILGAARPAWAQDASLGDITVIARSGGRETSGITDSTGAFLLGRAATGEVTMIFRRGGCEGSFLIGSVASNSSIVLSDVVFDCDSGSSGTATPGAIGETFAGVVRDDPDDTPGSARLCTRVGSDDRTRTVPTGGALVQDRNGDPTTAAALRQEDLLEVEGTRSNPGESFVFDTDRIRIVERDVEDECDDDPLT